MTPPRKTRHYPATPRLVRRTRGDLSVQAQRARALRSLLTASLLEPRPNQPRLVSSAEGTIRRMLLTMPDYAVTSEPLLAVYRSLLGELSPEVALVVLTHDSVADAVGELLAAAGRSDDTVIQAPDHLVFSVWAEDGYVVVTDDGAGSGSGTGTYFVEPYAFPRYGDGLVAEFVSNATDLRKAQAPLYFQGGNLLIGDDFFLIGADYPAESLQYVGGVLLPRSGEAPAELIRRLYGEYLDTGRRLVYVGSTIPVPAQRERRFELDGEDWSEILYGGNEAGTVQPVFHIDMFVTLVGRDASGSYQVLVGDPAMAAELMGERVAPHAMREVFDSIANGLRRIGFEVIRNPMPLVYVDDPGDRTRFWYFATANNALVEDGHVYLPTYAYGEWESLAPVEARNVEIWEDLGFTVHLLADCHPLASSLGAVHCIKKYLARA